MAEHGAPRAALRRWVDPALERLMGRVGALGISDPLRAALAAHRRAALARTLAMARLEAEALAEAVTSGDTDAVMRFDALVARALEHMRALRPRDTEAGAFGHPGAAWSTAARALERLERPLFRQEVEEMDDPTADAAERAENLAILDRFNAHNGSYAAFAGAIEPLVERAEAEGRRPVRVHDLAAGHGGFALFLAATLGARVAVEASDLVPEYLALGERRAQELGVPVAFSRVDALELSGLAARGVDVITCTQSLHHFTPGMVARMLGEAARAAHVGVCFIDGERSWLTWALVATAAGLYGRQRMFAHDARTSVRRMFYEEELALVTALAPGVPADARVETGTCRPAHVFVRLTRRARGTP
jgi:2-polyprenyl-3-methyl-5-hydroxy-6-metoxy-1,4-benzoquinol methylase